MDYTEIQQYINNHEKWNRYTFLSTKNMDVDN